MNFCLFYNSFKRIQDGSKWRGGKAKVQQANLRGNDASKLGQDGVDQNGAEIGPYD